MVGTLRLQAFILLKSFNTPTLVFYRVNLDIVINNFEDNLNFNPSKL